MYEPALIRVTPGADPRLLICQYTLHHQGEAMEMQVFLVVAQEVVVLVDTLTNPQAGLALLEAARPYLTGRRLLVVNTHADYDHAWGNQVFAGPQAVYPAPIIATVGCARRLRSAGASLDRMKAQDPAQFNDVRLTPPNVQFEQRLRIEGGDLSLELLATPGHTTDHLAVYIPELRLLLAGDAAEDPFPFAYDSLERLRASLDAMAALNPESAYYCHAPLEAGAALLQRNRAYFDRLEQRCRQGLASGKPLGDDAEGWAGFPFEEALAPGQSAADMDFYRRGHVEAICEMVEELKTTAA